MNASWGPPMLLAAALIWWICTAIYAVLGKPEIAALNGVLAAAFSYLAYTAFRRGG
jgi:hypothetical protein